MADTTNHDAATTAIVEVPDFSPEYIEQRRRALEKDTAPKGMDEFDPKHPAGHAYAIRKSTWLTSNTKRDQRKASMDIKPQEVIDALNEAGVKNWVLMGLHGYVGYMPDPRATQDVDVMVPHNSRKRARKAISARWPELVVRDLSQVTRFLDPLDLDFEGHPKPAVDLMLPWAPFQELILKEYVIVDRETQHRLPTLEAALASKYAAMHASDRDRASREQDGAEFRRIARANRNRIKESDLRRLGGLVWEKGVDEIVRFIQIALTDEPFPI